MESGVISILITIRPTAPYDFAKVVNRLKSHNEMVTIEDNCKIVRAIRPSLEVEPVLIKAHSTGSMEEPMIEVQIMGTGKGADAGTGTGTGTGTAAELDIEQLTKQLERMFTADMDILSFYERMEADPVMNGVVRKHYGLRLLTDPDLFECMVRTIIGQQLNVSFASTLTRRLALLAAKPLMIEGNEYLVFPSPSQVADLSVAQLRELQFSTRKAEYVIEFAKMVRDGKLELDDLYGMDNEQIMETLLPLRGIGRWTVECLLLFGLARRDLLPAADIGLRNAVRIQYGLDHQATEAEVRAIGEAWAPYRSYATYYLWETLEDKV